MPAKIRLEVITPERVVFDDDIEMLIARAIDGDIGVMAGHTPMVTALETGVMEIKTGEEEIPVPISDGFMEVKSEKINVIVRTAELPKEIDVERARRAKERAQRRLREEKSRIDEARAEAALERAKARLRAAEDRQRAMSYSEE